MFIFGPAVVIINTHVLMTVTHKFYCVVVDRLVQPGKIYILL
jgi:hypothetical protein